MRKPPLDPDIADLAPTDLALTAYDEERIIRAVYFCVCLNADTKSRLTGEKSRAFVLHIDPETEPMRARHAFDSHLARRKWMTEHGYRRLLRGGASG